MSPLPAWRNCRRQTFPFIFPIKISWGLYPSGKIWGRRYPMGCSTAGFPVHHQLPELAQTHGHRVGDTIRPFHPLSSPSPPAFIFPNTRVFSNMSALDSMWPKYWSISFSIRPSNEYSGLISFRIWLLWSLFSPRDSQESSPTPQFKSINSSVLSFLYGPTLTSIHNYWENRNFD